MQVDVLTLPFVSVLLSTLVLLALLLAVTKNMQKAAIITTLFWGMFFTLTYLFLLDKALGILNATDIFRKVMIPIFGLSWAILISCACFTLITKKALAKPTRILNEIGGFLILLEVLVIASHEAQVQFMWMPGLNHVFSEADNRQFDMALQKAKEKENSKQPDVYFILLDEFASRQVLRRFFDYDNQDFLDKLRQRGFVVATSSHSNYPRTMLTLASMMNMTYLDELATICGADTSDWSVLIDMIRDSRIARIFDQAGYRQVLLGSAAAPTDWNPRVDSNHTCTYINWFSMKLMQASFPGLLPDNQKFFKQQTRQQRLCTFSTLEKMASSKGPDFVFAHFLLPHEPFVFGANGEDVDIREDTIGETWHPRVQEGYKNQTVFLEKKILQAIDHLLAGNSKIQPIIILQGDHGPNSSGSITTATPNDNVLVERYGVLSAYLVPKTLRPSIYDTITPVNVFRLIVNHLFDTSYKRLPDKLIYTPYPYPYRFTDITTKVNSLELEPENQTD